MAELRTTGEILEKWNELHKDNPEAPETCFYGYVNYKDVAHLLAENQRLRDCLAWYADKNHWCWSKSTISAEAEGDRGQRAREALGGK